MIQRTKNLEILSVIEVKHIDVAYYAVKSGENNYEVRVNWGLNTAGCTCPHEVFRNDLEEKSECRHIKKCRDFKAGQK